MKTAQSYKTRLKGLIEGVFSGDRERLFSASDVYSLLTEAGVSINLTTVYRNLDAMTREGVLMRFSEEGSGRAMYKHAGKDRGCLSHLHARCTECGEISHLDCSFVSQISEHTQREHGFTISPEQTMLYGICEKCRSREGK